MPEQAVLGVRAAARRGSPDVPWRYAALVTISRWIGLSRQPLRISSPASQSSSSA